MKLSSLVRPTAVALAITLGGTSYVAAQDNADPNAASQQDTNAQQSDAKQSSEDKSHDATADKDARQASCPVCGLKVENAKDDSKGVRVVDVKPGSPADQAGVKKDDVLVSINDKDVKSSQQLRKMMSKLQKKSEQSTVKVALQHDGEDRQLTLTLKSKDEQASSDDQASHDSQSTDMKDRKKPNKKQDAGKNAKTSDKRKAENDAAEDANKQASLGVTLDPAPAQNDGRGVRISSVYTNGPAQKAGLKTGDRILKVDGKEVSSVSELQDSIDKMAPDQNAKISVMVDGQEKEFDIELVSKAETIQRAMVGNQPAIRQPAVGAVDQSLAQTLAEIRNELRELRQRVDAIDNDDQND